MLDDVEALDTEVIDWAAYAADNYRITADAATASTAAEPRWVVAEYWIDLDSGEYVYDRLTEPMTLWEAENYEASELAELIARAETSDAFDERERLIGEIGALVREQIKAAR
jgi:hypothetical protein